MCLSFRPDDAQFDPAGGFPRYTCYRCVHCEQVTRCNELKKLCAAYDWDNFISHEQIDKIVGADTVSDLKNGETPSRKAWIEINKLEQTYTIQLMPTEVYGKITTAYFTRHGVMETIKRQFTTPNAFLNHMCDAQAQKEVRALGLSSSGLSIINAEIVNVYYQKTV